MSAQAGSNDQSDIGEPAAIRLARLLQSKACIVYHEDLPDREFPSVTCSVYGVPETNELLVKLSGTVTFVEAIESPLLHPPMADRIFGIDLLDSDAAFGLAEEMWEKHKTALIAKP